MLTDRYGQSHMFKRYPMNTAGRDFVVGDIHGCFSLVYKAMGAVAFDRSVDRLFSLGDLIDRGPDSEHAGDFLDWICQRAVSGNHCRALVQVFAGGGYDRDLEAFMIERNGMGWITSKPLEWRRALAARFAKLPVAIEIETARGTVGLVHAGVPEGMDWPCFIRALSSPATCKDDLITEATWTRKVIQSGDARGVGGVGRVFVGHTPVSDPKRLGNVYYIDTGAVFGLQQKNAERGRMTLANLTTATEAFMTESIYTPDLVAVIDMPAKHSRPFGEYTKVP